jgi:hypothetical protein
MATLPFRSAVLSCKFDDRSPTFENSQDVGGKLQYGRTTAKATLPGCLFPESLRPLFSSRSVDCSSSMVEPHTLAPHSSAPASTALSKGAHSGIYRAFAVITHSVSGLSRADFMLNHKRTAHDSPVPVGCAVAQLFEISSDDRSPTSAPHTSGLSTCFHSSVRGCAFWNYTRFNAPSP